MGPAKFFTVEELKALRVDVDSLIQKINAEPSADAPQTLDFSLYSMSHYQADIKLREAKMWIGKMLEGLGNPFPPELADKAPVPTV